MALTINYGVALGQAAGANFAFQGESAGTGTITGLPPGMTGTFSAVSGGSKLLLAGTPTSAGNFPISGNCGATAFSGRVQVATITSGPQAVGTVGQAFTFNIATTPAASFTEFVAADSTFPPGTTYSTGSITGTPTTAGTYTVSQKAVFDLGPDVRKPLTITIGAGSSGGGGSGAPIEIEACINEPFSYQFHSSGAAVTYHGFGLPSYLTLNESTGEITCASLPLTAGEGVIFGVTGVNTDNDWLDSYVSVSITGKDCSAGSGGGGTGGGGTGGGGGGGYNGFSDTLMITSALTATTPVNAAWTGYEITAEGGPTGFDARGLPTGITRTGAILGGTPTKAGVFNIQIIARKGTDSVSATLVLTVTDEGNGCDIAIDPATGKVTFPGQAGYEEEAAKAAQAALVAGKGDGTIIPYPPLTVKYGDTLVLDVAFRCACCGGELHAPGDNVTSLQFVVKEKGYFHAFVLLESDDFDPVGTNSTVLFHVTVPIVGPALLASLELVDDAPEVEFMAEFVFVTEGRQQSSVTFPFVVQHPVHSLP